MAYLRIGDEVPEKGRGSKLTKLQRQFVDAYTNPESPGYSSPTNAVRQTEYRTDNPNKIGQQLMQHPLVASAIKEVWDARRERMELTADYVIHKIVDIVEQTDKDSDRLRALELLGKSLALWKERQEISGPDGEAIKYQQKVEQDADDFARRMASLAKRARSTGISEVTDDRSTG